MQFAYTTFILLVGVCLSNQSYYDTNYAFGGNYGVSSFGIGSFGFGGSAIGGHMKPKPTKYVFKPRKVRHYPFKHKMLKPKPQPQPPPQLIDQWPQASSLNFAMKPMEMWPIDESYMTIPQPTLEQSLALQSLPTLQQSLPTIQQPLQLYPTLEDILKLSNPQPIPSPPAADLSPNLDGIVRLLTSQLSTGGLPSSSIAMKPSYTSWLSPDFESNNLVQSIDAKGMEIIQETKNILSTTQSPLFDLEKLLRKAKSMQ